MLTISGLSDSIDALRNLSTRESKRIVRKGLRAGARLARDAEREEAPSKSGRLRKSITVAGTRAAPKTIAVSAAVRGKKFAPPVKFYPVFIVSGFKTRSSTTARASRKRIQRVPANDFVARAFGRVAAAAAQEAARIIEAELPATF